MNNYGILSGKWPYFISISQCYVYTQGTWTVKINVTEKRDYIPSIYFYKPSTLYIKKIWIIGGVSRCWNVSFFIWEKGTRFDDNFMEEEEDIFSPFFDLLTNSRFYHTLKSVYCHAHQHSISVKNRLLKPGVFDEVFTHFSWIISFS